MLAAVGLFITLCASLLVIFPPLFVEQTKLRLYDLMLSGRSMKPRANTPVIVGIDEKSLEAYGQWPWPRYRLAMLLGRLHEMGADAVAIDILMPEPDRTSPGVIMSERLRDLGLTQTSRASTTADDENTRRLSEVLAEGRTILGYYFDFSGAVRQRNGAYPLIPPGMIVSGKTSVGKAWPVPDGTLQSIPELTSATNAEGFTNAQHDIDGVLRRAPLLLRYDGQYCPSLALGAVLISSNEKNLYLTNGEGEAELGWAGRRIPLDNRGNLLIDFRDRNFFPYISANEILSNKPKAGALRGKVAVLGITVNTLGDYHLGPSGRLINGLEVHATIIDNILSGKFISRPGWAVGVELFTLILLGLMSTWALSRPGFVLSLLTVAGGVCGSYFGGKYLLLSKGLFVSPLLPMLTPVIVMAALGLLKYGIEARKVSQRTSDLVDAQDTIIVSMSALAEARDEESGGHILRTQRYVETLARQLSTLPKYRDLDETSIQLITKSAPIHDIGKVGVPDYILHKPGPLTNEEFEIMKKHTIIGARALSRTIDETSHPASLDFLHYARQLTISHHEKWDGSGYPHGLSGTDIPLAGRIMALADVYDALISKRVYKSALSHEDAAKLILEDSGKYFDPDVVEAFVARSADFIRIASEFADHDKHINKSV